MPNSSKVELARQKFVSDVVVTVEFYRYPGANICVKLVGALDMVATYSLNTSLTN